MFSATCTLARQIWAWLPEATVGLRFATTLLGFCMALRWTSRRRRHRRHSEVGLADKHEETGGSRRGPQIETSASDERP